MGLRSTGFQEQARRSEAGLLLRRITLCFKKDLKGALNISTDNKASKLMIKRGSSVGCISIFDKTRTATVFKSCK